LHFSLRIPAKYLKTLDDRLLAEKNREICHEKGLCGNVDSRGESDGPFPGRGK